jgi:hypothetical protein
VAEGDGKGPGLGVHDAPPAEGADRRPQALLWGLRRPRDEAQLTRAIAEVARVDGRFASAFVQMVLDVAAAGAQAENVQRLRAGGVPRELACRAEQHLRDMGDISLGRVDLRFDGGDDFTLFVEKCAYFKVVSRRQGSEPPRPPLGSRAISVVGDVRRGSRCPRTRWWRRS